MKWTRPIGAAIAGYTLFALSAVALFQLSGIDPHARADWGTRLLSIGYGAGFAVLAGYVAAAIEDRRPRFSAGLVAGFVALAGAISLVARPGEGAIWSQVSSIVLFAPLVLLGSALRVRADAVDRSEVLGTE